MSRPHLLLVDADPKARNVRAAELRQAGFDVTVADTALAEEPDLSSLTAALIVDGGDAVTGAQVDGARAIHVPFYLVSEDEHPDLLQHLADLGAAGLLKPGPTLPAQLWALLRAPVDPASGAEVPVELTGTVTPEGIVEAIEVAGARDAVINCQSDGGDTATLWLRGGRVTGAQLGSLADERALARLFTWKTGLFVAHLGPHERPARVSFEPKAVIAEAVRRAETWLRLVDALSGLETVYRVDYINLARRLGEIPDEANALLRLVDGQRTLAVLLEVSPLEEAQTLAVTLRLRIDGVVVSAAEGVEQPSAEALEAALRAATTSGKVTVHPQGGGQGEGESGGPIIEGASLPLVSTEAIDDALAWVSAPSGLPQRQGDGPIPVVRYAGMRGNRRDRLEADALTARAAAASRRERPTLLVDEVMTPGAIIGPLDPGTSESEIFVTASHAPPGIAPASPPGTGRSAGAGLIVVATAALMIVVFFVFGRGSHPLPEGPPVRPPTNTPAPAPAAPPPALPPPAVSPPPVASAQPPPPSAPEPVIPVSPTPAAVAAPVTSPPPVTEASAPAAAAPALHVASPPAPSGPDQGYATLLKAGVEANAAGRSAQAISLLEQAIAKKKTAVACLELGKALYNADKLERAIEALRQSTALDAKAPAAYMYLGTALQDAHRTPEARAAYQKFLELEPASSQKHGEIASVLSHMGG